MSVVVVGSSLTGLLVSASLSRASVAHTLIGGPPPDDRPRLGESMNEGASALMWRLFGFDATPYLFPKSHISLLHGDLATLTYAANPRRTARSAAFWQRLGLPFVNSYLVHVDRGGLDRALYDFATQQPACRFVRALVTDLELADDRVTALTLDSGERITTTHVFDATGPRALVAEAAGVARHPISDPQRVVWTHLRRTADAPDAWWRHGTNLLRPDTARDGIHGISWLIPLGDTLSVGVSVDAATHAHLDDAALLARLVAAWNRRGPALDAFADHAPLQSLQHSYHARARGTGANWMVCGGGFLQVWFPTSSGLWGTMLAAALAPRFAADDPEVPAFYERAMRSMIPFHREITRMVEAPGYTDAAQVHAFWNRWLAAVWDHFGVYLRTARGELHGDGWRHQLLHAIAERSKRTGDAPLLFDGWVAIRVAEAFDDLAAGYRNPARYLTTSAVRRALAAG